MDHQRGNYSGLETQTWITSSTAPPRFGYFPRSHLSQACPFNLFHRFTLSYNIARQRLMRLRPVQSSKSRLWGFWGGCSGGVSCWWCVLDLDCMILYVWVAGRWKQNEKTGAKSRINMKKLHPFLQARRRQLGSWHLREYGRHFSSSGEFQNYCKIPKLRVIQDCEVGTLWSGIFENLNSIPTVWLICEAKIHKNPLKQKVNLDLQRPLMLPLPGARDAM